MNEKKITMSQNIVKKFQNALDEFVSRHNKNPNVIGIILSGSFIHSIPDKNSDLDISVILRESKTRERGNTWINGIEIEYFMNPIEQVKEYFKTEVGDKAPTTAHMLANSVVLYEKGPYLRELIEEAKSIINRKRPKMSKFKIETEKYSLDDLEKDLEDTFLKKDKFAFQIVSNDILKRSLSVFFSHYRMAKEKSKRLHEQLEDIDKNFSSFFEKALFAGSMAGKYKALLKLIRYDEKLLGGKRPKEWKLRGPVTYSKKDR